MTICGKPDARLYRLPCGLEAGHSGVCAGKRPDEASRQDDWFLTASGKRVHVLSPDPEQIDIEDIAHALSHICRFGGHSKYFYSVAQHSVMVCGMVTGFGNLKRCALLHDASEAYLGDVFRPLKRVLPEYLLIEEKWERAIAEKFELSIDDDVRSEVKACDLVALATERRNLGWSAYENKWSEEEQKYRAVFGAEPPQSPVEARHTFLQTWYRWQQ